MKNFRLFAFGFLVSVGATQVAMGAESFSLSRDILKSKELAFVPHKGPGAFDSYIMVDVPYAPVESLFKFIQTTLGTNLKNRGEAHITVITPVEFRSSLESKLSIDELNQMAVDAKLQEADFSVLGLGSGKVSQKDPQGNSKTLETFYLVVSAPELLQFRKRVQDAFVAKGGDARAFEAQKFYPHITVGFTERDLHIQDGVVKDSKSLDSRFLVTLKP
jgi:2'-5' RNA ligase